MNLDLPLSGFSVSLDIINNSYLTKSEKFSNGIGIFQPVSQTQNCVVNNEQDDFQKVEMDGTIITNNNNYITESNNQNIFIENKNTINEFEEISILSEGDVLDYYQINNINLTIPDIKLSDLYRYYIINNKLSFNIDELKFLISEESYYLFGYIHNKILSFLNKYKHEKIEIIKEFINNFKRNNFENIKIEKYENNENIIYKFENEQILIKKEFDYLSDILILTYNSNLYFKSFNNISFDSIKDIKNCYYKFTSKLIKSITPKEYIDFINNNIDEIQKLCKKIYKKINIKEIKDFMNIFWTNTEKINDEYIICYKNGYKIKDNIINIEKKYKKITKDLIFLIRPDLYIISFYNLKMINHFKTFSDIKKKYKKII